MSNQIYNNNYQEHQINDIKFLSVFIVNYILYCFLHVMGINYIFTYIIYQDAMINPSYINKKQTDDYNSDTIIVYIIIAYLLLYIQQFCLSLRFSKHIFGVCIMTQVTCLLYIYNCVTVIINTDCKYRMFLTCYDSDKIHNLDNTNLLIAQSMIFYAMIICIGIEILFVITSFINNICRKKYYFHKKLWENLLHILHFISDLILLYLLYQWHVLFVV